MSHTSAKQQSRWWHSCSQRWHPACSCSMLMLHLVGHEKRPRSGSPSPAGSSNRRDMAQTITLEWRDRLRASICVVAMPTECRGHKQGACLALRGCPLCNAPEPAQRPLRWGQYCRTSVALPQISLLGTGSRQADPYIWLPVCACWAPALQCHLCSSCCLASWCSI